MSASIVGTDALVVLDITRHVEGIRGDAYDFQGRNPSENHVIFHHYWDIRIALFTGDSGRRPAD